MTVRGCHWLKLDHVLAIQNIFLPKFLRRRVRRLAMLSVEYSGVCRILTPEIAESSVKHRSFDFNLIQYHDIR